MQNGLVRDRVNKGKKNCMNVTQLTELTFTKLMKSQLPVLVDFGADWCPPCRAMEPLLDELSKDLAGKALIAKVNVDENPSLAAQFGVRNLPTFLVFKNGKPVEKIVGAAPKSVLEKRLLAQGDTVSL